MLNTTVSDSRNPSFLSKEIRSESIESDDRKPTKNTLNNRKMTESIRSNLVVVSSRIFIPSDRIRPSEIHLGVCRAYTVVSRECTVICRANTVDCRQYSTYIKTCSVYILIISSSETTATTSLHADMSLQQQFFNTKQTAIGMFIISLWVLSQTSNPPIQNHLSSSSGFFT
jgi:hypothetical protein